MGFFHPFRSRVSTGTFALFAAGAFFFACSNPSEAQSSRGTVTGFITGITKAAVVNATVDLNNEDTNVTRTTNTNESGIYRFDAVDPGNYTVKITAPGFKPSR